MDFLKFCGLTKADTDDEIAVVAAHVESFLSVGGQVTLSDWVQLDETTRAVFIAIAQSSVQEPEKNQAATNALDELMLHLEKK